jgi:hypothetical protein
MVTRRLRSSFRGNVTGFGLLFRRSEERLIETSFNGICFTLPE